MMVQIPQGEAGQQCQGQSVSKMGLERAAPLAMKRGLQGEQLHRALDILCSVRVINRWVTFKEFELASQGYIIIHFGEEFEGGK